MSAFGDAAVSVCCRWPSNADPVQVEPRDAPAGSMSAEDEANVKKLRTLVETELLPGTDAAFSAEAQAHLDDFTLLRFLRSRPDSVDKAMDMFKFAMAWRVEHHINEVFAELHPGNPNPTQRQRLARAHYFSGFGGLDRSGDPYFIMRVGAADLSGFAREPELASLITMADACNMEGLFRSVRLGSAATGRFCRALIVVDIAGFGLGALRHIGLIKSIMKVGPNVFPEGASKVLVVNAPRAFAAAWSLVSPLLPQRSRDKCSIVSCAATPAALAERIDPAELPTFLDGQRTETFVARAEAVPPDAAGDLPLPIS